MRLYTEYESTFFLRMQTETLWGVMKSAIYIFLIQPRSQGLFPGLGAGREKTLASAGHMSILHPEILDVITTSQHNQKCQNHDGGETVCNTCSN